MSIKTKKFFGGLVIGLLVGALIGGYTVACVMGTAFINYSLKNSKPLPTVQSLTQIK